jgi:hypothetical protein
MTCRDPALAWRVLELGEDDAGWPSHLAECIACRGAVAIYRAFVASGPPDEHPDAAQLVAYDEGEASLSPEARRDLGAHLAGCAECREALCAVPAEVAVETRRFVRPWRYVAAAGWLVAAALAWRALEAPPSHLTRFDPVVTFEDVVLSNVRGDSAPAPPVPASAQVLRVHFVLGEDVPAGSKLEVSIQGGEQKYASPFQATVTDLDEWGRPVVALFADWLPPRPFVIGVKTPGGRTTEFWLR